MRGAWKCPLCEKRPISRTRLYHHLVAAHGWVYDMKRDKPLRSSRKLKRSKGPKRTAMKRRRDPEKKQRLFERRFHSEEFVQFTKRQACVCDGVGRAWGCDNTGMQTSHDPTRGAGGTWMDTHPASFACHNKIGRGAQTFWKLIGKTREEANRAHYESWIEYSTGLSE